MVSGNVMFIITTKAQASTILAICFKCTNFIIDGCSSNA
jgi:hypothetical protein